MDIWKLIATERRRLVQALTEFTEEDWNAPSLCAGWSNKDTLAHIVSTAEFTPGAFVLGMFANGFNFSKMVDKDIQRFSTDCAEQLLKRLRAAIPSHNHPPGPVAAILMETVVHGEDIAFPLGKKIKHSEEGLIGAVEFAKTAQPLVGCRRRIAGLTLRATDVEWSTGTGPEVSGPLPVLLLAMSGRKAVLDSLTGEGVDMLRKRP